MFIAVYIFASAKHLHIELSEIHVTFMEKLNQLLSNQIFKKYVELCRNNHQLDITF